MIEYSAVIPVYNEEESLPGLFNELSANLDRLKKSYEIIFVNDCSSDSSLSLMEGFKNGDSKVKIVNLPSRSGQTQAMRKGLEAVEGNVAITLDADLQNDPADIPKLLEKMDEGFDMVCGWRKSRMDTPLKAGLSKSGNVLQRLICGLTVHDVSCTLRAFKKDCIDKITLNWEGQHRFIPLILYLKGYKIGEIVSNHRLREYGVSKYSHTRIFRVIFDFFKILITRGEK